LTCLTLLCYWVIYLAVRYLNIALTLIEGIIIRALVAKAIAQKF